MRFSRLVVLLAPVLVASTMIVMPAQAAGTPTVTITSPADGSFADGTITVSALGTDDGAGGDLPQAMTLYVDYVATESILCVGGGSSLCMVSFALDADALTPGAHELMAGFSTNDASVISDSVEIGAHSPQPAVSAALTGSAAIYATLGGAYVGLVARASGWTREADVPVSVQMLADGALVGTPTSCPPSVVGDSPCSKTLSWRLSRGSHTVQARLTVGAETVDSHPVTINVLAPSVVITSPAPATVVHSSVAVTVVGTSAGPEDAPQSLTISTNRVSVNQQTKPCPDSSAATCTAMFTVPAALLSSLVATFTTNHLTVTSPSVPVIAYSTPSIGLGATAVAPGKTSRIDGGVHSTTGSLTATTVQLTLTPAIGKARTVTVPLTPGGAFSYAFRASVNMVVRADLAATPRSSAAHASTLAVVTAAPACHLASHIARSTLTPLTCVLTHLPKGTEVTLQYSAHKRWHTVVSGRAAAGMSTLRLHWGRSQLLWLRVVVASSKVYGAGVGKPFSVRVA